MTIEADPASMFGLGDGADTSVVVVSAAPIIIITTTKGDAYA